MAFEVRASQGSAAAVGSPELSTATARPCSTSSVRRRRRYRSPSARPRARASALVEAQSPEEAQDMANSSWSNPNGMGCSTPCRHCNSWSRHLSSPSHAAAGCNASDSDSGGASAASAQRPAPPRAARPSSEVIAATSPASSAGPRPKLPATSPPRGRGSNALPNHNVFAPRVILPEASPVGVTSRRSSSAVSRRKPASVKTRMCRWKAGHARAPPPDRLRGANSKRRRSPRRRLTASASSSR
mmetsp:Transcript_114487/g.365053  ORF Transcript_114487/g.365053 Transcript_114487/m.365053 type:complete len:243 (-) Transcript_114487:177-905(-)